MSALADVVVGAAFAGSVRRHVGGDTDEVRTARRIGIGPRSLR